MRKPSRPVALYARVSTQDQTCENQLLELRRYAEARGWQTVEYVDHAVSGSKDRRPALDQLSADVKRYKVSAVACWRLDRLGRNLRRLVLLLDEWQALGVAFVTLGEGIDTTTPAGRLQVLVLASRFTDPQRLLVSSSMSVAAASAILARGCSLQYLSIHALTDGASMRVGRSSDATWHIHPMWRSGWAAGRRIR